MECAKGLGGLGPKVNLLQRGGWILLSQLCPSPFSYPSGEGFLFFLGVLKCNGIDQLQLSIFIRETGKERHVCMTVFNRGMTTCYICFSHCGRNVANAGLKAWMVYCHFINKTRSWGANKCIFSWQLFVGCLRCVKMGCFSHYILVGVHNSCPTWREKHLH